MPTDREATIIWWSFYWRWIIASILSGPVAGFIIGFALKDILPTATILILCGVAGFAASAAISFLLLKGVLKRRFKDFRIKIVRRERT